MNHISWASYPILLIVSFPTYTMGITTPLKLLCGLCVTEYVNSLAHLPSLSCSPFHLSELSETRKVLCRWHICAQMYLLQLCYICSHAQYINSIIRHNLPSFLPAKRRSLSDKFLLVQGFLQSSVVFEEIAPKTLSKNPKPLVKFMEVQALFLDH